MRRKKSNEKIIQKYKHLIDTQINKWTVLNIIPPDAGHKKTSALCKCQCGTTKQVRMQYLLDGRSKDCGCGRKKMLRETRTKNLVGKRFGKLLVRELLEESDNFNRRKYICDCENTVKSKK